MVPVVAVVPLVTVEESADASTDGAADRVLPVALAVLPLLEERLLSCLGFRPEEDLASSLSRSRWSLRCRREAEAEEDGCAPVTLLLPPPWKASPAGAPPPAAAANGAGLLVAAASLDAAACLVDASGAAAAAAATAAAAAATAGLIGGGAAEGSGALVITEAGVRWRRGALSSFAMRSRAASRWDAGEFGAGDRTWPDGRGCARPKPSVQSSVPAWGSAETPMTECVLLLAVRAPRPRDGRSLWEWCFCMLDVKGL